MRHYHMRLTLAAIIFLGLFATGCDRIHQTADLNALRNAVSKRFHVDDVSVFISRKGLVVGLANSGFEDVAEDVKFAQAQRVAEFARDNYRDMSHVTDITIMLFKKSGGNVFQSNAAERGYFVFDRNAKVKTNPYADPGTERTKPEVGTTTKNGQTTVSGREILLYGRQAADGTTQNGMQMLPHFSVPGNAVTIPQSVDLDLAAFSPASLYEDDHQFTLSADGNLIAQGAAQFVSSGKIADGQTAEFMSIKLGFAKFKKLAMSKSAQLNLGSSEITLRPEQLHILLAMMLTAEQGQLDNSTTGR